VSFETAERTTARFAGLDEAIKILLGVIFLTEDDFRDGMLREDAGQ
jgi:hypothetical protein